MVTCGFLLLVGFVIVGWLLSLLVALILVLYCGMYHLCGFILWLWLLCFRFDF